MALEGVYAICPGCLTDQGMWLGQGNQPGRVSRVDVGLAPEWGSGNGIPWFQVKWRNYELVNEGFGDRRVVRRTPGVCNELGAVRVP